MGGGGRKGLRGLDGISIRARATSERESCARGVGTPRGGGGKRTLGVWEEINLA